MIAAARGCRLVAALLLPACAQAPLPSPGAPPTPSGAAVVARALPAVVLLVGKRPDGKLAYGAGLLLGPRGPALTSLHVVDGLAPLQAMLHRPRRSSYTPMDGGLDRYLFENRGDLVPARLLRSDPFVDLALVEIDGDTSGAPRLEMSSDPPRPGDPVLALGHPHETVWSFTQGVVSAIHHGAIQHDAAVSQGSSGGPLLDARGRVIGITNARVVSGGGGLAFARPIALARRLLAEAGDVEIDRSTLERAVQTCFRAQELGSPSIVECFDWEGRWRLFRSAMAEASRRAGPELTALVERDLAAIGGQAGWIDRRRREMVDWLRLPPGRARPAPEAVDEDPRVATIMAEVAIAWREVGERIARRNGLRGDLESAGGVLALLRQGIRLDGIHAPAEDRAWVLLVGRNKDGSEYRFSERYVRGPGGWVQRFPPLAEDLVDLPSAWPLPFDDHEVIRLEMVARIVRRAVVLSGTAGAPPDRRRP